MVVRTTQREQPASPCSGEPLEKLRFSMEEAEFFGGAAASSRWPCFAEELLLHGPTRNVRLVSTLAVVLAVGLVLLILNSIRSTTTTTTVRARLALPGNGNHATDGTFLLPTSVGDSRAATSSRWDRR